MKYNIYFELVSLFFVAIIYAYHKIQYSSQTEMNKRFRRLVVLVFLDNFLDVLSAIAISYTDVVPVVINIVLTAVYFTVASVLAYQLTSYVRAVVLPTRKKNFMYWFNLILILLYSGSQVVNMFMGFYVSFSSTGEYIHGPLYIYIFVTPFYFIGYSGLYLIHYCRHLQRRQIFSVGLYVFLTFTGITIQTFFFPTVLLTGFAASCALLVVLFLLETPDYQKLMLTLKELEIAKNEAETERKRADQANKAKSRFLANVSHEVRTPINAILGMDEMILRETEEEKTKQYAMDVRDSAYSLLGMINEILDSAVIESGKMSISFKEYNIGKMLHDLLKMMNTLADEKNLKINIEIKEDLPSILYGDGKRIQQILVNLLTNAVKYTRVGDISFIVSGVVRDETVYLHFEVQDKGIGIKKEDFPRLFTAFDRIENEDNKEVDGSGLGINIAEQILELMDSKLIVLSEYGKGSSFSFNLEQKIVNSKPIGDVGELIKKKEEYTYHALFTAPDAKILVVDDSKINLRVFCNLLKNTQVQVTPVESGKACLEMVAKNHYDIIFLDHMMPEMDGVETLKQMREMEHNLCKDTPVVMLTANATNGARETYMAAGFDEFLSKPVIPDQLEKLIYRLIENKEYIG